LTANICIYIYTQTADYQGTAQPNLNPDRLMIYRNSVNFQICLNG
jgi:hypothetical protein